MPAVKLLKIRVSLKGRPIKSYTFKKEMIRVGRDPDSDIFLDNPGVSRDHCKIEMNPRGYYEVEDLGSANGTFLNDEQIDRETLMNNDVVRAGKFSLWIHYEEDQRGKQGGKAGSPSAYEGTTVLSTNELEDLMARAKEHDTEPQAPAEPEPEPPAHAGLTRTAMIALILVAFVVGSMVGAGATFLVVG